MYFAYRSVYKQARYNSYWCLTSSNDEIERRGKDRSARTEKSNEVVVVVVVE